jgi:hypothetical protein
MSLLGCHCLLAFFPHLQKTMISWEARCCRVLHFFSVIEDDKEPPSSSLSLVVFL